MRSTGIAAALALGAAMAGAQDASSRCEHGRVSLELPAGWKSEARGEQLVLVPGDGAQLAVVYMGARPLGAGPAQALEGVWREVTSGHQVLQQQPPQPQAAEDGRTWHIQVGALASPGASEATIVVLLATDVEGELQPFVIATDQASWGRLGDAALKMVMGARWKPKPPATPAAPEAPPPAAGAAAGGAGEYLLASEVSSAPGWSGPLAGRWLELQGSITETVLSRSLDTVLVEQRETGRLVELVLAEAGTYTLTSVYASNYLFKSRCWARETGRWKREGDQLVLTPARCEAHFQAAKGRSQEVDKELAPRRYALFTAHLEELVVGDQRPPRKLDALQLRGPAPGWLIEANDALRLTLQRMPAR